MRESEDHSHRQKRRKSTMTSPSRMYWDAAADLYQNQTRISCEDFHYGPLLPGDSDLRLHLVVQYKSDPAQEEFNAFLIMSAVCTESDDGVEVPLEGDTLLDPEPPQP